MWPLVQVDVGVFLEGTVVPGVPAAVTMFAGTVVMVLEVVSDLTAMV